MQNNNYNEFFCKLNDFERKRPKRFPSLSDLWSFLPTFNPLTPPQAESIVFTVVQAPRHGTIERTGNGQHYRQTGSFTMDDVYQNRVSYNHDGSNSLKDRFTFTVADGTNPLFMVEEGGKEVAAQGASDVCVRVCVYELTFLPQQEICGCIVC